MSISTPVTLICDFCQHPNAISQMGSLNLDRFPELKMELFNHTLGSFTCEKCQKLYRLSPEFPCHYLDRSLWLAVYPKEKIKDWRNLEAMSLKLFNVALGSDASSAAQEIGKGVFPRLVFGWEALKEKILIADHKLKDSDIELCKMIIMRDLSPLILEGLEIRLDEVTADTLLFNTINIESGAVIKDQIQLSFDYINEINEAPEAWKEIRDSVEEGIWVDILRVIF